MKHTGALALASALFLVQAQRTNILITNDDGWAVANVRAQNDALKAAGYDIILSCPAVDKSGTGSSTATPVVLTTPCEYDTCPTGSPAVGFNASDPRLNYVNAFPADSARYGIQTLAPQFFNGNVPDLVVAGPNVGSNAGSTVLISGTVGAASEAAKEGIPSVAFSGPTGAQVSYTTLESDPTSTNSLASRTYAALSVKFVDALLESPDTPILPPGISINVNYPSTANCSDVSVYSFVLSRINASTDGDDVDTCGGTQLPDERTVIGTSGCFSSVSVFNASTKADVGEDTQAFVLARISGLLSCLP